MKPIFIFEIIWHKNINRLIEVIKENFKNSY